MKRKLVLLQEFHLFKLWRQTVFFSRCHTISEIVSGFVTIHPSLLPPPWYSQYKYSFTFFITSQAAFNVYYCSTLIWASFLPVVVFFSKKISLIIFLSCIMLWFRAMPVTREPLVPRPFANIFGEKHSLLQMMAKFVKQTNSFWSWTWLKGKEKLLKNCSNFALIM